MDDKLKQEVYDLINKAQAEMNAGNLNSANASMDCCCNTNLNITRMGYENSHEQAESHKRPAGFDDEFSEEAMQGLIKYKAKHGSHFTDDLASWASKQMQNAHGEANHHWSVADVKSAFERFGLSKPEEITWGDIAYAANMHYADYFGVSLKTETDCVRQAYADAADPDGYPGKIFNRWFADVLGSKKAVPWDDFI